MLFGPTRRRVPKMIDLTNPVLLGPVQNQEHYMQGVVARRNNFVEPILAFFEAAYRDFAELTGRYRFGPVGFAWLAARRFQLRAGAPNSRNRARQPMAQ